MRRHCAGCVGVHHDGSLPRTHAFQCAGANGQTSDGYHTFDELYEHRITLFVALCAELALRLPVDAIWRSRLHSDGSAFEGWFVAGIWTKPGDQITYHLPDHRWPQLDYVADARERAPEFDGHTSADVLTRLRALTGQARLEVAIRRRPRPEPQKGFLYVRPMMQCKRCRSWWSGEPLNGHVQMCPCGGELEVADLVAHESQFPYHPFDPSKK